MTHMQEIMMEELMSEPAKRRKEKAKCEVPSPGPSPSAADACAAVPDISGEWDVVSELDSSHMSEESRFRISGAQGSEAKLGLFDLFDSMQDGDIAVRAAGAQTSPFVLQQGGRQTKRVYLCNHPTKSGFRAARMEKKKLVAGDRRGGKREGGEMREFLEQVPAGKCSAFVELTSVRAGSLLTGTWRR